jgi:SHS2 domain-containing protein
VTDYELIDHTADLGIIVRAPQLSALFAGAAHALFDLTCDLQRVSSGTMVELSLEDAELECLMVSWLNELVFLHETQRLLFDQFDVRISGSYHLDAQVRGEVFDARRHTLFRGIKAATYHQLEVIQLKDIWTAQIIFDV